MFLTRHGSHWPQGFTLIEQWIVLILIMVISVMAVPSFHHLLAWQRLNTAQLDFMAMLHHARQSAVTLGKPVIVCSSNDGNHCNRQPTWDRYWLVQQETYTVKIPNRVLWVHQVQTPQLHIKNTGHGRTRIRFQPDGSAAGSNLIITFCQSPKEHTAALIISISNAGRIRAAKATQKQQVQCIKDFKLT